MTGAIPPDPPASAAGSATCANTSCWSISLSPRVHRTTGRAYGGLPAASARSRTVINPETGQAEEMHCMETRMAPAGTVIRLEQTGGGYGDPFTRPRELVLRDVEDGYVSPEMAFKQYGCRLPGC